GGTLDPRSGDVRAGPPGAAALLLRGGALVGREVGDHARHRRDGVRKIPTDEAFRLDTRRLTEAIAEDRAAGLRPFCVVATVGTTSTTSVDPVREIAEICRREGLWLHVDGAYGGAAGMIPEMRWIWEGVE